MTVNKNILSLSNIRTLNAIRAETCGVAIFIIGGGARWAVDVIARVAGAESSGGGRVGGVSAAARPPIRTCKFAPP